MFPRATYRVQFNRDFPFPAAEELVPYLAALGISHLYASPIMTARAGSMHGYDITDPTRVNPELGGDDGLASLVAALRAHGMGLVVDIVPNHMAASPENAWWVDVLENGPSSRWAYVFDIVWQPSATTGQLDGRVLLPILGDHYGSVLESGQLTLSIGANGIFVNYWETSLPLDPTTYGAVLSYGRERLQATVAEGDPSLAAFDELLDMIEALPPRDADNEADMRRRQRDVREVKRRLWQLYREDEVVRRHVDENIARFNGTPGSSRSYDLLDNLLTDQAYRLAYWRVASQEINYRRFFDVADLVAVRIGEVGVFNLIHERVLALAEQGMVDGLRVDHIDGLWDPTAYTHRLRERLPLDSRQGGAYVVVEKILAGGERLRETWPVQGTSGYDFLTDVTGVLSDTAGLTVLDASYRRVSGLTIDFHEIAYEQKRRVMGDLFGGDIRGLTLALDRLTALDRHGRDLTQRELGQAIFEVIANFAVYRTYINSQTVGDEDRAEIERAVQAAKVRNPYNTRAVEFLQRVLTLDYPPRANQELREEWRRFAMRFQQFTGPIMAKGHEDTAFYIYNRLISLNEVGSDPGAGGLSPAAFHERNCHRQARWPHTMLATSTHDTKRSEDVRARINVIAELAEAWDARIDQWRRWNERGKSVVNDQIVPDANEEWLIYQTLAGAWPFEDDSATMADFTRRIQAYMTKALREAKVHTSWTRSNLEYEQAVGQFVETMLQPGDEKTPNPFLDDFACFRQPVAYFGALNSLSQVLLKVTSPGVPDLYQGNEVWDFSLVDPDNRRPVDYRRRAELLDTLQGDVDPCELLGHWQDGRIKLHVTSRALRCRAEYPDLFTVGEYAAASVAGEWSEHVIAFSRRHGDIWAIAATPRLLARLALARLPDDTPPADRLPVCAPPLGASTWGNTCVVLPESAPECWRNVLTGEELRAEPVLPPAEVGDPLPGSKLLPLADLFAALPVALLIGIQ